ncbi:bifunctional homocysteine S-methyltransferase/methylenetetrahydrofolate reductase [Paenibacillus koleovorans]|uniref:bifunctional homocysteine S-methyltransferase/methylenetetrahydrofolate reductase n=1 Tax=Paenibacillus koleovorans TaxID=121608 RepID=UPI000FD6CD1D|nr:bifunctional homocysteine S-methyltransferase/methylenetetrahydrofolate reductase [Paenibacillus koleovorans]
MKMEFKTALSNRVLAGDGAMGTYLYQLGFTVGASYEEFNLLNPEAISGVHRRYYDAGARVIETNTFSANREKLSKFGLEHEVKAINRAGAAIARQAVGADAYVVGAIGSIRGGGRRTIPGKLLQEQFREQLEGLLEAGVDGILLETFYELEEMEIALQTVLQLDGSLPVICQFASESSGGTRDGILYADAFLRLREAGAAAIGFNCHSGPNGVARNLEQLPAGIGLPLSVFPNAGLPSYVDGQYVYGSTPEYFAENALKFAALGARIIGGCCGTTPEHIAAIAGALQSFTPDTVSEAAAEVRPTVAVEVAAKPKAVAPEAAADEPSLLEMVRERHTVMVEWDTPRDLDITRFMEGAEALRNAHVDFITMADNAVAMTRMSNLPLGMLVKERFGMRPLLHIACRDRNMIGTQSHLMGLHAVGMNHVLVITGDPSKFGDQPGASSVYDMTSFEMIRLIKQLNEGMAFSGKPLKQKSSFVVGAAFNPNVKHLDKAVQRLEKKIEAGADYIMTQPVYDARLIERIHESTKHLNVPIFLGFMPLVSGNNAEFLHNEVPGIVLSDEVRGRMAGLSGPEGRARGNEMMKELLDVALPLFKGIYLMTPMHFYGMCVDLTNYVWEKTGQLARVADLARR